MAIVTASGKSLEIFKCLTTQTVLGELRNSITRSDERLIGGRGVEDDGAESRIPLENGSFQRGAQVCVVAVYIVPAIVPMAMG